MTYTLLKVSLASSMNEYCFNASTHVSEFRFYFSETPNKNWLLKYISAKFRWKS